MTPSGPRAAPSIYPILSVHFVGSLGFSLVIPFLVYLVTRWGGNAFVYGVVGATYSFFQLIAAPVLGRWSDRFGRRRILLVSQGGTLLSWLVFLVAFALPTGPLARIDAPFAGSFALTLPLLVVFLARATDGLTGGNISVATAYLADISTDADRSAHFGKLALASNLGFVIGPALAGVLGATALGEILPVLAAAAISVIALALIAFGLPESHPRPLEAVPDAAHMRHVFGAERRPCYRLKKPPALTTWRTIRLPGVTPVLAIHFLVMLGFNFFYIAFPVYAATGLHWSVAQTGTFFMVMSAAMALVQGPVLARASRRFSDLTLIASGGVALAASFACFTMRTGPAIYGGVLLLALGNGVMWPSIVAVLSARAGAEHQGAVQGVAGSLGALASIVGLIAGGVLYDRVGAGVFFVCATVILLVVAGTPLLRARPATPARPAEA